MKDIRINDDEFSLSFSIDVGLTYIMKNGTCYFGIKPSKYFFKVWFDKVIVDGVDDYE